MLSGYENLANITASLLAKLCARELYNLVLVSLVTTQWPTIQWLATRWLATQRLNVVSSGAVHDG